MMKGATMSDDVDDNPVPASEMATTNERPNVPALSETRPAIRSRYAMRTLLSEIAKPMALIEQVKPAWDRWMNQGRSIALARTVNPLIPSIEILSVARDQLHRALTAPANQEIAEMLIAMMMDSITSQRPGDVETTIEAMIGVVADIGDPLANAFIDDRDPKQEQAPFVPTDPISPVVLAVAVKQIISRNIFRPQPSELRKACIAAFIRVRSYLFRIDHFWRAREEIDRYLLQHDSEPVDPALADAAAKADRVVELWEALKSNKQSLLEYRGNSYLPDRFEIELDDYLDEIEAARIAMGLLDPSLLKGEVWERRRYVLNNIEPETAAVLRMFDSIKRTQSGRRL